MQPWRPVHVLAAAALAVGLVVIPAGGGPSGTPFGASPARAGTDGCATGWTDTSQAPSLSINDMTVLGSRAVSVGSQRRFLADRSFVASWWDGTSWASETGPRLAGDAALLGVGGDRQSRIWAVGFVDSGRAAALAVHWEGGRWVVRNPPRPRAGGELLSAVDIDPSGRVWAVGTAVSSSVVRTALAWERRNGRWIRHGGLDAGRGTGLTAVRAIASDDVWAVGSRSVGVGIRPLVSRWNGQRWHSQAIQGIGSDATLAGIAGERSDDLWAVGWTTAAAGTRPLVLHRTSSGWSQIDPPDFGGVYALLADVSLDAQGRPWVVGGVYRDTVDMYVPIAARLDASGWTLWPRPPGSGRYLDAVSGDLSDRGWASGRSDVGGLRLRACDATASTSGAAGRLVSGGDARLQDDLAGDEAGPRPRPGLMRVPRLAPAVTPAGLTVKDVAASVGIVQDSRTYGATWEDLNDDGRKDLFISGHAGPAALYLRVDGGYARQPAGVFRDIDRHDCDIARIDADRLADVVCTGGADRGVGFKANEIWIDPVTGSPDDQGPARGIADPVGRGRDIAVFDVDGDSDPDIVLGTMPLRYDSQPSPTRLMRNDGTGHFRWVPDSGIPRDRGAWCLVPVDMDGDGDKDLLQCAVSGNIVESARLLVLQNQGGHFTDVTRAMGVRAIGERDAAVGSFGGDAHPDLVQLSGNRIRVSIWRGGRWVASFERAVTRGRAVAVGDVNGDGHDDVYLQQGSGTINDADVVLLNRGDGTRFITIAVPSTSKGSAQDVIALDWDRDGRSDFLVLNGNMRPGPVQLIAFSR